MSVSGRPVKFSETLTKLINQASPGTRKRICSSLNISPSTLSQYEKGKVNPPLEKLAALAVELQVTLDYLVFGDDRQWVAPGPAIEGHPLYGFIEAKLEQLNTKAEERNWAIFRVADIVARRIDRAANLLIAGQRLGVLDIHPGRIDDDECLRLETYANQVQIFAHDFSYDLIERSDGSFAPGKFFPIVMKNIRKGCRYEFILPKGHNWTPRIHGFIELLKREVGLVANSHCEFRIARRTFISGLGILRIDIDALKSQEPVLFHALSDYSIGDRVAYIIPPSTRVHGDLLISRDRLELTQELFKEVWDDADQPSAIKATERRAASNKNGSSGVT